MTDAGIDRLLILVGAHLVDDDSRPKHEGKADVLARDSRIILCVLKPHSQVTQLGLQLRTLVFSIAKLHGLNRAVCDVARKADDRERTEQHPFHVLRTP